jgi:hypothetical protein
MVYVKLLKDVAEGGAEFKADGPRDASGQRPKLKTITTTRHEPDPDDPNRLIIKRSVMEYRAGVVVTMHEASADKWVKAGLGEIVKAPTQKA